MPSSIGLYPRVTTTLPENIEIVQYAEEKGFDSVWQNEYRLARDAVTPVASYATVTDDLRLGLGVINNWTRNVALVAQTLSTLEELAGPDRIIAGIGTWWDPIAARVGIDRRRPLLAIRETVEALQQLLSGERVTYDGEFVQLDGVSVEFIDGSSNCTVPVYVGATGPQMLELTGEYGDGCVMNFLNTPEYTKRAIDRLDRGAERSGRSVAEIERVQTIICSMDPDIDSALDRSRRFIAQYAGQHPENMSARSVMDDSLIDEIATAVGEWPADEDSIEAGMDLVSDDLVRSLTASGTPEECRRAVREYVDAGCQEPVLVPLTDPKQIVDEFAAGY